MLPLTVVDQFLAMRPRSRCGPTVGATASRPLIWARMASASAILKFGAPAASRPGPMPLPGAHHQQVAAQAGIWSDTDLGGAVAQGHHGDHRADADDDAQDGEEGAHQVAPDLAQGEQAACSTASVCPPVADVAVDQAVHEMHDALWRTAAMSGSWVTIRIVMPWSRLSAVSSSMISRLRCVSRLPVGSSASSTAGW